MCEIRIDALDELGPCIGALRRKAHRDRAGSNITWVWTPKGVTIILNVNIMIVHGGCTSTAWPITTLRAPVKIIIEAGIIVKIRDKNGQLVESPSGTGGWLKHRLIEATTQLNQAVLAEAERRGSKPCDYV
jgi:hypothetical protein